MPNPLRLGIAGLGTVGVGVIRILENHAALIAARSGQPIEITAVSARSKAKDRGVDLAGYAWEDDPVALAKRGDIDVFVELMGGEDGPAKASVEAAIVAGKHVVTANKAMLAIHGQAMAEAAESSDVALKFEAAVAGGIPVIKSLTEGLAGNKITRVMGVMNGTCNYILTRMENEGVPYEQVFADAKALGYLEADPNLDVGGIDAGHKLALLSSIAFGTKVNFAGVELEGIQRISITDIEQASDMGFRIKLLGVAQLTGRGLEQRMQPCLVPKNSPFGQLENATNMVLLEGDAVGQIVLRGAGAGEGPTASAVMSDVIDIARGFRLSTFGQPAIGLKNIQAAQVSAAAAFYLRLMLKDAPGVLHKITGALADAGVSIDRMRQYSHADTAAPVLMVTHKTTRAELDHALAGIISTGVTLQDPVAIRIEDV
ncbi:MAG: homoserine dehydrogenase [Alphaproteobacteria bacterium]|nr:homoserine dehydrogenase [Alphaproteobacteria bacterium]